MAIPPANRMVAGNIASDLMLVISAGRLQPGKGNLRAALSSTIIEWVPPVKHVILHSRSSFNGSYPYKPYVIQGCPK
jgi:hypothetical protein